MEVGFDFADGVGVIFLDCEAQELVCVTQTGRKLVEDDDNLFELSTFLAEGLRTFGLVPYIGLFQLALDFQKTFRFAIVVKDTSSTPRCVQQGP